MRQFLFPLVLLLFGLAIWWLSIQQPELAFLNESWQAYFARAYDLSLYIVPASVVYLLFFGRIASTWRARVIALMVVAFALQLLMALQYVVLGAADGLAQLGGWLPAGTSLWVMSEAHQTVMVITGALLLYFLYGVTVGKYRYEVRHVVLHFPDLPEAFEGFKLVQISDIHSGSFDSMRGVKKGVDLIAAQQPDLLVFTGDLVNGRAEEILPYTQLFSQLSAPFGKYAVTGNHDYSGGGSADAWRENVQRVQENYGRCGFELLNNRSVAIQKNNDTLHLVGVENWGKPPFPQFGDLDRALSNVPQDGFKVLLSHDPSHWDEKTLPHRQHVHLTLAGHTHGMQFGLDFGFLKWSPVQYVYPRWAGLYEEARQYLYVNRGFGFLAFPGRIGVYPEITLFELHRSS